MGGAAIGAANRLATRDRRPRVFGIPIPDELNPQHLAVKKLAKSVDPKKLAKSVDPKKLTKNLDLKDVVKHIGDAAEQIETRSEEVRTLSGQAKRLSRRLS